MSRDIVKDSTALKKALLERWEEIGITDKMIEADARKRGIKGITKDTISSWRGNPYRKGALNQENLLWLSVRYGINCAFIVKKLEQPYDEQKALDNLKAIFG